MRLDREALVRASLAQEQHEGKGSLKLFELQIYSISYPLDYHVSKCLYPQVIQAVIRSCLQFPYQMIMIWINFNTSVCKELTLNMSVLKVYGPYETSLMLQWSKAVSTRISNLKTHLIVLLNNMLSQSRLHSFSQSSSQPANQPYVVIQFLRFQSTILLSQLNLYCFETSSSFGRVRHNR